MTTVMEKGDYLWRIWQKKINVQSVYVHKNITRFKKQNKTYKHTWHYKVPWELHMNSNCFGFHDYVGKETVRVPENLCALSKFNARLFFYLIISEHEMFEIIARILSSCIISKAYEIS